MRVDIQPELLRWACERSGVDVATLLKRFPKFTSWEKGEASPTLKQLEIFARATYTPVGLLLLDLPPVENLPIPDFRTMAKSHHTRPSANLLDAIYICQQRQEWYRDYLRAMGEKPLSFVGTAHYSNNIKTIATEIRHALAFDIEERRYLSTWAEALRLFIEQADAAGILVMCSGVVLNNNNRHLDPTEFRGFAITDAYAPLIFINGADSKSAQMFTLAHELAHIWLGQSALSDIDAVTVPTNTIEKWCNQVAAELLVPLALLREIYQPKLQLHDEVSRLSRQFKVSTLVILRRIYDAGGLSQRQFWQEYYDERIRLEQISKGTGGNFYLTQAARVSKRFARALVSSTLNGQTLYRDAFQMLGFSKLETFQKLGNNLGVYS